jgi:hypothetical protein
MLNKKTTIALVAALVFGGTSGVLAGEGSPDLSYPQGYDTTILAPHRTAPVLLRGARGDVVENYGWSSQPSVRGFTLEEKALFDRATGSPDHN